MMNIKGMVIVNFSLLVLCLKRTMPIRAPEEPPITANKSNTPSLILQSLFLALILSIKKVIKAIRLIIIR